MKLITSIPGDLRPGDILLYGDNKLSNEVVKWKEGDPDTDHVEIYVGSNLTVASRNGIGVNTYQFQQSGLVHVRRPLSFITPDALGRQAISFDLKAAMEWFEQVKGAPYGWGDIKDNAGFAEMPEDALTNPAILVKTGMDCSHFASLFLRAGGSYQFDPSFDARKITPRDFKLSIESVAIWDIRAAVRGTQTTAPELSPRAQGEVIIHNT
jgi:hypothetical protein